LFLNNPLLELIKIGLEKIINCHRVLDEKLESQIFENFTLEQNIKILKEKNTQDEIKIAGLEKKINENENVIYIFL